MRPTGSLHLGNYEGALKNWIRLQDSGDFECFYFIADLHALENEGLRIVVQAATAGDAPAGERDAGNLGR